MESLAIKVPDIGDFSEIPVIEILVKVGDVIKKEQPLIVLESDKATMEVPSDVDGTVLSIEVKMGDLISMGSVVAHVEPILNTPLVSSSPPPNPQQTEAAKPVASPPQVAISQPQAGTYQGGVQHECQLLVLGFVFRPPSICHRWQNLRILLWRLAI